MENASKALIMAGAVLISISLISFGIYLFKSFSSSSKNIISEFEQRKVAEFNEQFYKYENININAHEVVSIGNLARENNSYYDAEEESTHNEKSKYISVWVDSYNHFEKLKENDYIQFVKNNSYRIINGNVTDIKKNYKCVEIQENEQGRVNFVKIVEI